MNIRHLTYFVEVVKEKNFTKAASNLHLSQPALSRVIKDLEDYLGVQLIRRSTKGFELTDAGEIFYENSITAIKNVNAEFKQLVDSVNYKKGRLVIGIPPVVSTVYFASIISTFRKKYPDIHIKIIEEGANSIKEKVKNRDIDLGIILLPIEDDNFISTRISSDELMLVLHKDHKLTNKNSIELKELKDEVFILLDNSFMLHNRIIEECRKEEFEPNIFIQSSQWDFLVKMVSLGEGISILPKPIIENFKNENVVSVPILGDNFLWEIGTIVKKNNYISFSIKEFIKHIKNEFKNNHES